MEEAEEKARAMAGSIPRKNANGLMPPRSFTVAE